MNIHPLRIPPMKPIRLAFAFMLLALPACGDYRADVAIVEARPGVTRAEYLAIPAGERLESAKDVPSASGRGVDVEVVVKLEGQKDVAVPLWYALTTRATRWRSSTAR